MKNLVPCQAAPVTAADPPVAAHLDITRRRWLGATAALGSLAATALTAGCGGAEAAAPTIDETIVRLQTQELQKTQIAFSASRNDADIQRFLSFFDPGFVSINLGPTGVTTSAFADLDAGVRTFPTMPFTMSDRRAVRNNETSVVLTSRMHLETPFGAVDYLASSVWSRDANGQWLTTFYQATPL